MKGSLALLCLLFCFIFSACNPGELRTSSGSNRGGTIWSKQLGAITFPSGSAGGACKSLASDFYGNIYCGGYTLGSMVETRGGNAGQADALLIKFSPTGELLWLKQFGAITKASPTGSASSVDYIEGVAVDQLGNVIIIGETASSLVELKGGGYDIFAMKLSPDGDLIWAKQFGSVSTPPGLDTSLNEHGRALALDTSNNIYIGGHATGDFAETFAGGSADFIAMKLDTNGNFIWATQLGQSTSVVSNSGTDWGTGIAVDQSGNVYLTGETSSHMGEGSGGGFDAVVVKFNSSGGLVWVRQLGATTIAPGGSNSLADAAEGIAINSAGEVIVTGYTYSDMGETNAGDRDLFAMKLNPLDGALIWLTHLGSSTRAPGGDNSGNEITYGEVAIGPDDRIYFTGGTTGAMGSFSGGGTDAIIVSLTDSGNISFIKQFGANITMGESSGVELFWGITISPKGRVFIGGYTGSNLVETRAGTSNIVVLGTDLNGNN